MYTRLAGLQYKILYNPGVLNTAADALSRHPAALAQLQAISAVSPSWIAEVLAGYESDSFSQSILQQLAIDPASRPPYSLSGIAPV